MSSDPNRPRPRSSKKRRAVQGGPPPNRPGRPAGQRGASGRAEVRGGTASSGIPTLWLGVIVVVVFAIGVALAGGLITFGGGGTASASRSPGASSPAGGSPVARGTNCPTSAPAVANAPTPSLVTIETAKGAIAITVDPTLGPKAAANFVALASCGFYDGIGFHRLVPGFVIQGGDPTGTGGGGPGYEFADDAVTVPYTRGLVAMANSGPNTNGSQFFIVLADDTGLGPKYSVFGRVTSGMDVVDAIAAMPNSGGQENRAVNPVTMDKVTVGPAPASSAPASSAPASSTPSSSAGPPSAGPS